jgi:hypothetical protein
MATVVHFRDVETWPSTAFTQTRCVVTAAIQAAETTEAIARNHVELKERGAANSYLRDVTKHFLAHIVESVPAAWL